MMEVRWIADAVRDLTAIGDYTLGEYGAQAARNVAVRIQKNVDLVCDHPEIGRVGRKPGTRERVIPDCLSSLFIACKTTQLKSSEYCTAHSAGHDSREGFAQTKRKFGFSAR